MKRTRRIQVEIARRELSIFAAGEQPVAPAATPAPGLSPALAENLSGLLESRPSACSICGATRMEALADALSQSAISIAALQQGIAGGEVHFQQSPAGTWWVCVESVNRPGSRPVKGIGG